MKNITPTHFISVDYKYILKLCYMDKAFQISLSRVRALWYYFKNISLNLTITISL